MTDRKRASIWHCCCASVFLFCLSRMMALRVRLDELFFFARLLLVPPDEDAVVEEQGVSWPSSTFSVAGACSSEATVT